MKAEDARAVIRETRSLTDRPFNVNVFCHKRAVSDPLREARWLAYLEPHFARFQARPPTTLRDVFSTFADDNAVLTMLLEERPAVVSFHFGLPEPATITALHDAGTVLFATATNRDEADRIADAHIDAIVAQGAEAGGHRGTFDPAAADELLGTTTLVRLLVRETSLPIVAAGGIMDGAGLAAVLVLGAQAAQLGTAFLVTPESAADSADRAALLDPGSRTAFTRAISGRLARGIENAFTGLGRAIPLVRRFPISQSPLTPPEHSMPQRRRMAVRLLPLDGPERRFACREQCPPRKSSRYSCRKLSTRSRRYGPTSQPVQGRIIRERMPDRGAALVDDGDPPIQMRVCDGWSCWPGA
jgi:nitronate monooxygenase